MLLAPRTPGPPTSAPCTHTTHHLLQSVHCQHAAFCAASVSLSPMRRHSTVTDSGWARHIPTCLYQHYTLVLFAHHFSSAVKVCGVRCAPSVLCPALLNPLASALLCSSSIMHSLSVRTTRAPSCKGGGQLASHSTSLSAIRRTRRGRRPYTAVCSRLAFAQHGSGRAGRHTLAQMMPANPTPAPSSTILAPTMW